MKNFDGGVDAALVPPHPDEEIHRDEHHFPEEVEEEQIERQKDADDAGEHPQQLEMEEADPILDLRPRGDHRHEAQEPGEQDEQQAEAVEAEMEPDAERIDPPDVDIGEPWACAGCGRTVPDVRIQSAIAIARSTLIPASAIHRGHRWLQRSATQATTPATKGTTTSQIRIIRR